MADTNIATRIQLIGDLKGYLDLGNDTVLPLTYSVSDIRDLSKKKGTVSKSIVLPASKNNNRLLNYYFDVNIVAGTFNVNKLQYCNVIQNGVTILENALIQLVSVNKEQKNNMYEDKLTYTVLVKDKTSDFFTTISNKYLTDITGLTQNFLYTADNVIDTFDNTYVDGYKFIMPFNPELSADTKFELTEFSPGIYARYYFDKIFSNAGYIYNWPEMDSNEINFSKLIIPYNGDVIRNTKVEFENYKVIAQSTAATINQTGINYIGVSPFNIEIPEIVTSARQKINITDELQDLTNSYVASASTYVVPNIPSATNDIKYNIVVKYDVVLDNPEPISVQLKAYPEDNFTPRAFIFYPTMNLVVDGNIVQRNALTTNQSNLVLYNDGKIFAPGITDTFPLVPERTVRFENTQFGANPLSQIYLETFMDVPFDWATSANYMFGGFPDPIIDQRPDVRFKIRVKEIKVEIIPQIDTEYSYNVPININRYVPEKVKQSDFIKSIFTMFNCYVSVNKDNSNQLDIITRDKYYDDGKLENWTKKLVKDKEQEIKFLPELQNKKFLLTYKQDDDVSNQTYQKATAEIYGQLEYSFNNEYVKDSTTPEIVFSPTPVFNAPFGAVLPMWAGGSPKNNIRILYDGGELSCERYDIYNWWTSATNMNVVSGSTYPFISHWNKPKNPTFDLNFGVCSFYFRTDDYGALTNNNLFNLHWRRTLNQINNGKLLTAYFMLNQTDIQRMKLNDKIRIDNSYWNINKIQDYDANSTSPTKVELISIDDNLAVPYETREVVELKRNDPAFYAINVNTEERNRYINNNVSNNVVIIDGRHNLVTENASGIVLGNDNTVNTSSIVLGNNNSINVDNVLVIGDGITADTNNTFYANNIIVSGGTINNIPISGIQSQLELINISGNTGWRLYGQDPLNYGQIGQNAVDFSIQSSPSSNGATGNISFAEGNTTIAGGNASHAEGYGNESYGSQSHSQNYLNKAFGDSSHAGGEQSIANGRTSFIHSTNSQVDGIRSVVLGGENITGATDDTVYVPNLNINYTPPSISGTTGTELLLRESDGSIKTITITELITLLPSGMGDFELILDVTFTAGTASGIYTIIKDDLNYGTGLTLTYTNASGAGDGDFFDITFPTSIANKIIYKYGEIPREFQHSSYWNFTNGSASSFSITKDAASIYNTSNTNKRFTSEFSSPPTTGDILNFILVFRALP